MIGHKFYLSDEYSIHELDELKENYKLGEQQLLLYDENREIKQMQKKHDKELGDLKKQVKSQSEILKNLDNKTLQKLIMTLKDGGSLEDIIKEYFGRTDINKWEKFFYKIAQEENKEKEGK